MKMICSRCGPKFPGLFDAAEKLKSDKARKCITCKLKIGRIKKAKFRIGTYDPELIRKSNNALFAKVGR